MFAIVDIAGFDTYRLMMSSVATRFDGENFQTMLSVLPKDKTVLDFGCGRRANLVRYLREQGYSAEGYDFPEFCTTEYHNVDAWKNQYDYVVAYNVLNIQYCEELLDYTLAKILSCTKGAFIYNIADKPRYGFLGKMKKAEGNYFIIEKTRRLFGNAEYLSKRIYPSPLIICKRQEE